MELVARSTRVVIADDEPIARERIRKLLAEEPDCHVVAECGDGHQAIEAIRQHSPDVVFLDVEMPKVDGFSAMEAVQSNSSAAVVFVTADEQHAVRAFDEGAADFLLKPFSGERFHKALDRARASLGRAYDETSAGPFAAPASSGYAAPLIVHSKGKYLFLRMRDIDYVRAAGNYVHIFCGTERHSVCSSMSAVEARLDPNLFVRIHRSAIVNIARIREAVPWFNGEHALVLQDGTELNIGRSYRERFEQMMAA
ncbi:MAG: LytR/AlgR family response regulator transcription factor [Terriglobales bacterium]|jgi:two-component system LytT family response regulator